MPAGAVRASGARIRGSLEEVMKLDGDLLEKYERRDPCAGVPPLLSQGRPRLYLGGAEARNTKLVDQAEMKGILGFLPPSETDTEKRFKITIRLMCQSDGMLADMTPLRGGPSLDVNTAFEMGFMAARGRPIFAFSTDRRNFTQRTRDYYARLGTPLPETPHGEVLRDPDGNSIEQFDMPDNLMLGSVVERSKTHVMGSFAEALGEVARRRTDLRAHEQVVALSFDWDDNVAYMPTKIYLYDRKSGQEHGVSTADFAEIRHRVYGFSGATPELKNTQWHGVDWGKYELRGPDESGSFREFRDKGDQNRFRDGIAEILALRPSHAWQGPSWDQFVLSLSQPESAHWTSIITARGQEAEKIAEGLKFLQREAGLLKELPETDHIYAVSSSKYQGKASSPSKMKAQIMKEILDVINDVPFGPHVIPVLDRDGKNKAVLHLWGFSDDDYGNFLEAVKELSTEAMRWPKVKITLFYTGTRHDGVSPHAVVVQDGKVRPQRKEEEDEAQRILFHARKKARRPALSLSH
jgi:nucleoside 2-deoxyribosyltransferase